MISNYLSKSDFKAAFECGTKLFYRKNQYPSTVDDDEFLRCLAEGGFMVEEIAHARLLACEKVNEEVKKNLRQKRSELDPLDLAEEVERRLREIFRLVD